MRILHTSDWHLGKIIHEHSLIDDQWHALGQIITALKSHDFDMMIIAGDIYDRSLPSADAVELLSCFLSEMRAVSGVPVIIIPGNHDSNTRLSYCADIISMSDIHIKTDPQQVDIPVVIEANGEIAHIYAIPFLDPWVYNDHSETSDSNRPTHESAVAEAINRIRQKMDTSVINIVTAHLFASGGITSDSERRFIGTSGEVSVELFDGFDYVALGHLHRAQAVGGQVHYSGSLIKYSFSEYDHNKQLLNVTAGPGSLSVEPLAIAPLRDMIKIKGTCGQLLADDRYAQYKNCYIEAELTDEVLVVNPINQLKKRFPYILSVRQVPRNIPGTSERERAERIKEGSTLTDDFIGFYEYIHAEKPQQETVKLFQSLSGSAVK